MGGLLSCCGLCDSSDGTDKYEEISGGNRRGSRNATGPTPDPEERRRQLAEAAEKRRQESENRGVKDPEAVRRMKERTEKREQAEEAAIRAGGETGNLKWSVT